MKLFLLIGGVLVGSVLAIAAIAGEKLKPVPIPLNEIWAYEMPGTRDIRELEVNKSHNYKYGPLMSDIRHALATPPPSGKKAPHCFAVLGTGLQALREAHLVLAKHEPARRDFLVDSDISVVFFSYRAGSYVQLHAVEKQGNTVRIKYSFVPHETREMTTHIALIPFAAASEGKMHIEILQTPLEQSRLIEGLRPISKEEASRIVCRSCSFNVVVGRKK